MRNTAVSIFLLLGAAHAYAVGAAGAAAIGAATRGHVSGSQPSLMANQNRGVGVCFWQVPEKLQWINLGIVSRMTVSEAFPAGSYELTLSMMSSPYGTNLALSTKSRDAAMALAGSVMQKLKDCAEGKP